VAIVVLRAEVAELRVERDRAAKQQLPAPPAASHVDFSLMIRTCALSRLWVSPQFHVCRYFGRFAGPPDPHAALLARRTPARTIAWSVLAAVLDLTALPQPLHLRALAALGVSAMAEYLCDCAAYC
jgi:hypothetical protein